MTELGSRGRFLLLYGSQTGQAQAIAEQIRERSLTRGFDPELHCLDQAEKKVTVDILPFIIRANAHRSCVQQNVASSWTITACMLLSQICVTVFLF